MTDRGDIHWAELAEPRGSAPGFRRPVLIVQADPYNRSRLATTIGVTLTSNLERSRVPGNVFLSAEGTGLPKDSVAEVTSLVTVDEADLDAPVGRVSDHLLEEVSRGLRRVLDL